MGIRLARQAVPDNGGEDSLSLPWTLGHAKISPAELQVFSSTIVAPPPPSWGGAE